MKLYLFSLPAPSSFFVVSVLFVCDINVHSGSNVINENKRLLQVDTTEVLTAGPWSHKKRGQTAFDSTIVRHYYFMKGGRFRIETKSPARGERKGIGTWRRKGNIIYSEENGFPGEHQHEIIKLQKDTLILYFVDRDVVDVLVRK